MSHDPASHGERAAAIEIAGERALCDSHGALFFPGHGLLCVSDLHLEKGSSLARRGWLVPPYDSQATLARLEAAVEEWRPRIVVSLGDSFHDGGGVARMSARDRALLKGMIGRCDWIWVEGNHDGRAPETLGGAVHEALHVGALTEFEGARDTPDWKALQMLYRVDMDAFADL